MRNIAIAALTLLAPLAHAHHGAAEEHGLSAFFTLLTVGIVLAGVGLLQRQRSR